MEKNKSHFFRELKILIKKEFLLEFRTKTGLQSILLYTVSTVFLCYWAIHKLNAPVWIALFWLILVFSALNAVGRSFLQESIGIQIYYYGLASPEAILLSKMIFNACTMLVLSFILLFFYSLTLGFPVKQIIPFFLGIVLGMLALSSAFTFLSAIASKASQNLTLLSILSIPILLPILFVVIHFSLYTLNQGDRGFLADFTKDTLALGLINLIVPSVSVLVFPYIWRN